jgi:hypothetical protein
MFGCRDISGKIVKIEAEMDGRNYDMCCRNGVPLFLKAILDTLSFNLSKKW